MASPELTLNLKNVPPSDSNVMRQARWFFGFIARQALAADYKPNSDKFLPLDPNTLVLTPYTNLDGVTRLVLDSSVEVERGRLQVKQHTLEIISTGEGDYQTPGIINADTRGVLIDDIGQHAPMVYAIMLSYVQETQ